MNTICGMNSIELPRTTLVQDRETPGASRSMRGPMTGRQEYRKQPSSLITAQVSSVVPGFAGRDANIAKPAPDDKGRHPARKFTTRHRTIACAPSAGRPRTAREFNAQHDALSPNACASHLNELVKRGLIEVNEDGLYGPPKPASQQPAQHTAAHVLQCDDQQRGPPTGPGEFGACAGAGADRVAALKPSTGTDAEARELLVTDPSHLGANKFSADKAGGMCLTTFTNCRRRKSGRAAHI